VQIVTQGYLNPNLLDQPSEDAVMRLLYPYEPHLVEGLHDIWFNFPYTRLRGFPSKVVAQCPFIECDPGSLEPVSPDAQPTLQPFHNIRGCLFFCISMQVVALNKHEKLTMSLTIGRTFYSEDGLSLFSPSIAREIRDRFGRMISWTE
jgi:hypothetical protein